MCGIVGIFNPQMEQIELRRHVLSMAARLQHRGPDDAGSYFDEQIGLAHRRLSILDLSERGRQPLANESGDVWLTCNGEIYNFVALRRQLTSLGHQFRSSSDSEVILHLYEEYGVACLERLEGMFAFALYDRRNRTLLLARDRTGEKPLYYRWVGRALYFASEAKCLTDIGTDALELSDIGLRTYLLYTQTPAPHSMFKQICKLTPAHCMQVRHDGGTTMAPYWRLDCTRKQAGAVTCIVDRLERVLSGAVHDTAQSDVPVAVTLSGGVDSSVTLALVRKWHCGPIKTFTLGSMDRQREDPEFRRAAFVAQRYGTEHSVFHFTEVSFADFEAALSHFDEPVGIYDIVYNLYFHRFIKGRAKVLLTGNGADEIFGGYPAYSSFVRQTLPFQLTLLQKSCTQRRAAIDAFIATEHDRVARRIETLVLTGPGATAEPFASSEYLDAYLQLASYDDLLDARLFVDLMVTLNHSASLADTTGMFSSIESRAPFLNRSVVEFAASLPSRYKVPAFGSSRRTKYLLKLLAGRYFPSEVAFARKYGCGQFIDYLSMMRTSWKHDIESLLHEQARALEAHLCAGRVMQMWQRFIRDELPAFETDVLRKLIIFFLWHRTFTRSRTLR